MIFTFPKKTQVLKLAYPQDLWFDFTRYIKLPKKARTQKSVSPPLYLLCDDKIKDFESKHNFKLDWQAFNKEMIPMGSVKYTYYDVRALRDISTQLIEQQIDIDRKMFTLDFSDPAFRFLVSWDNGDNHIRVATSVKQGSPYKYSNIMKPEQFFKIEWEFA